MATRRAGRIRRHKRVRSRISGTKALPRLSVFRSHKNMALQIIDDAQGKTLVSASTSEVRSVKGKKDQAIAAAKMLAERALAAGIKQVVFDRGGHKYHGRVKAAAEVIREARIKI